MGVDGHDEIGERRPIIIALVLRGVAGSRGGEK